MPIMTPPNSTGSTRRFRVGDIVKYKGHARHHTWGQYLTVGKSYKINKIEECKWGLEFEFASYSLCVMTDRGEDYHGWPWTLFEYPWTPEEFVEKLCTNQISRKEFCDFIKGELDG